MGTDKRDVESAALSSRSPTGYTRAADVGERNGARGEVEGLDGFVDGVFGHLAVGSPFAAGTGEQASGGDSDEVASDEGFGILGLGVSDKGTDSCDVSVRCMMS